MDTYNLMVNQTRTIFLVLLCCTMGFVVPLSADEAPDKAKVEALVKQLGDERFSVRQKAVKELVELGQPVAEQLRKLSNHPDPEVRARLQGVIDDIAALRKELKWLDPKNLVKAEYRSQMGGASVRLTFRNLTRKPVRIFWIESDGSKRVWRGILKAGESTVCTRSYKGHLWLITDVNKKPLGLYRIDLDDPIIAVRK